MNKEEFVNAVVSKLKCTKADAARFVTTVFDVVSEALESGDDVRLIGFGTFSVIETKAKKGRNPSTGAEIQIPAGIRVKFAPGKQLKESVQKVKKKSKK